MANCRRLPPLAWDLLERVERDGFVHTDVFEYRGAEGAQAKVKRAADRLQRCGLIGGINMAAEGRKRGTWTVLAKRSMWSTGSK